MRRKGQRVGGAGHTALSPLRLATSKRRAPGKQLVGQHTKRKNVGGRAIRKVRPVLVLLGEDLGGAAEDLRRHVIDRSNAADRSLTSHVDGQAKVTELYGLVCHQKNVFELDITVADPTLVQVPQHAQQRRDDDIAAVGLSNGSAVGAHECEQVAAVCVFLHQHKKRAVLKRSVQLHSVGMAEHGLDTDLALHVAARDVVEALLGIHLQCNTHAAEVAHRLVDAASTLRVELPHDLKL
mmetsp:Transcript_16632/g.49717  ORF Transcript_16632/g.49717 Transcript_16632/m.49717 type:complete len:238 (-) Transcript_16632:2283-2996(-)